MEFIKRLKKREFIEETIKMIICILTAVILICLMEGMITKVKLNIIMKQSRSVTKLNDTTIAYCIKEDEDKYSVVYHTEGLPYEWSCIPNTYKTEQECKNMQSLVIDGVRVGEVKEVKFRAPNALDLAITPNHYIIMSVLIAGVIILFVYRYISLSKCYKQIEKEYLETGKI